MKRTWVHFLEFLPCVFTRWNKVAPLTAVVVLLIFARGCSQKPETSSEGLEERLKKLEIAVPGVGAMMGSVQLHVAKLYFAGEAKNWKLAEFEIHEIEENLEKAATLRPGDNGVQLTGVFDAFERTQLAEMKKAIKQEDLKAFRRLYVESIEVCNSCHVSTGRPYLVITPPTAPPVPNQQWAPPPAR